MKNIYGFLDQVLAGQGRFLSSDGTFVAEEDVSNRDEVILFVSGIDVSLFAAAVPVKSDAEARRAAPFIIEDEIAVPIEETHFALGAARSADDNVRPLHIISLEKMRSWVEGLASHPRLGHAKLVAEHSVLLPGDVFQIEERFIGNIGEVCFALDTSMPAPVIDACLQGRSPDLLSTDECLAILAQRSETAEAMLDLRQGMFRAKSTSSFKNFQTWRLSAGLAAAVAFVWGVSTIVETSNLQADKERIEASIASAYATALPDAPVPTDYVRAVSQAVNANGSSGRVAFRESSAVLFNALLDVPEAQLMVLRYDRSDGELIATVSYSAYGDDTLLKTALAQRTDMDVILGDARQERDSVVGEIVIRGQRR